MLRKRMAWREEGKDVCGGKTEAVEKGTGKIREGGEGEGRT